MKPLNFPSIFVLLALCLFAQGWTGCGDQGDNEELKNAREELALLEREIEEERSALRKAKELHKAAGEEAETVRQLGAALRCDLRWKGGVPVLVGELQNQSSLSVSAATVHATRLLDLDVVAEERVRLSFDPILLPDDGASFSEEASPFVWGFREKGSEGSYRFAIEEIELASGKILRDNFSKEREQVEDIRKREERITNLRLAHGSLYTKIAQSED